MAEQQYFFKEVEQAFARFSSCVRGIADMLSFLPADKVQGMLQSFESMPTEIDWSVFVSPEDRNGITSPLTDDQKENIALTNKEMFSSLIASVDAMVAQFEDTIKFSTLATEYTNKLNAILSDVIELNTTVGNVDADSPTNQLKLTSEELYCALSLFDENTLRQVLASVDSNVFSKIFQALQHRDKALFISIADENTIEIPNLSLSLSSKLEKIYPRQVFFSENALNKANLILASNRASDIDGNFADKVDEAIDYVEGETDMPIGLDSSNVATLYNAAIHNLAQMIIHLEGASRRDIKKVRQIYSEWKEISPDAPNLDEVEENIVAPDNLSTKMVNSMVNDWIVDSLHKIMENETSNAKNDEIKQPNVESEVNTEVEITAQNSKRLSFPTRIQYNKDKIDSMLFNQILQGLYNCFGGYLENAAGEIITEDEFIYLFSGRINRPANYATPYYWNGHVNSFAGLVRLLYDGQEHGLDYIILPVKDKGKTKSSVKWSLKKQGLGKPTLKPIEDKIQAVVESVAGKRLKDVDLTKQNK